MARAVVVDIAKQRPSWGCDATATDWSATLVGVTG